MSSISGIVRTALVLILPGCVFVSYERARALDAGEELLTVATPRGAQIRVLLSGEAGDARVNLILLAGGDGRLGLTADGTITRLNNNFLVRSRTLFAGQGFLAAVTDAALDQQRKPGLLGGVQASQAHADDLAAVAEALRARNGRPVVAVGTSRGTVSAANLAARQRPGTVGAVVLTASLAKKNGRGANLNDLPLGWIAVPVLFVHNRHDSCNVTPLADVRALAAKLGKSKAELIVVESTAQESEPCQARSPHGFLGIEGEVAGAIAEWIRSRLKIGR